MKRYTSSANVPHMNTALPPILETKLADFRRRVWIVQLTEGLLAALCGIGISYLVIFALDRFVETPRLVRFGALIAAGTLGVAALAFVLTNAAARNALARWIAPWRNIERYTFVRIEPLPSRIVVPYAEPFALPLRLAPESRRSPASATARIGEQLAV